MKGLIITHKGSVNISEDEIKELTSNKILYKDKGLITFETTKEDLEKLAYKGQSFLRVLELLDDFVSDKIIDDLIEKSSNIKIDKNFKVKCTRLGEHDFLSIDVEKKVGEVILKNNDVEVDLNNPQKIIHIIIYGTKCFICDDLCIYDLSKRDYKIFIHPAAIRGTLAYIMLKIAGYDKQKIIVDPFCGSGTISIEAALYSNDISPHYFSKNRFLFEPKKDDLKIINKNIFGYDFLLKNVLAARKNAKIAGVDKAINFSKIELSWLDSKFDENEVDLIVSDPPRLSKQFIEKDFIKLMDELFYQAKFLLNNHGSVTLLLNLKSVTLVKEYAEKHGFIIDSTTEIDLGNEDLNIVKFIKK